MPLTAFKPLGYIVALLSIITALTIVCKFIYNAGANSVILQYQNKSIQLQNEYNKQLTIKQNQFYNEKQIQDVLLESRNNEIYNASIELHKANSNLANCKLSNSGLRNFLRIANNNTKTSSSTNSRDVSSSSRESADSEIENLTCQQALDSAAVWAKWYFTERSMHIKWIKLWNVNNN